MTIKVSHSCGGAVQMRGRSVHPGVSEKAFVCNSGQGENINLGADGYVEVTFVRYPTPEGNIPADLGMPATVVLQAWRRFGAEAYEIRNDSGDVLRGRTGKGEQLDSVGDKPAFFEFPFGGTVRISRLSA